MFRLSGGVFLGWSLGANDSANCFGTAVSSRMIKYSHAIVLTSVFVIIGALSQGRYGIDTLSSITEQTPNTAFLITLSAAISVTLFTFLKLPVSTSQAIVGSITAIGAINSNINTSELAKIVVCWILTPIGGFVFGIIFYKLIFFILKKARLSIFQTDSLLKAGLLISGCYGAYALGANNVANVTGVYSGNLLTPEQAVMLGAISIALGALTFSKKVMMTIGKSIVKLDAFSAFIAVFAHSVTVHIYAMIGVPVSTSQAIVGAVLAIGFIKGVHTVNFSVLKRIALGWVLTPLFSAAILFAIYFGVSLFS